jgi:N-acetylmuramic acid 6-phosphate etherase
MIKIGKVYSNLMIDLQSSNVKLTDRGIRIIMEVTGTDFDTAQETLERAGGSVKTAIVMLATGVEYDEAVSRLEARAGVLRRVLKDAS